MKRKKVIIICISIVALALLIASFFVKTGWNSRIEIPRADMVQKIEMELTSYDAGVSVVTADNQGDVNSILSGLSKARKASITWYSAANDVPSAQEFLMVRIHTDSESTTLYLYYENSRYYVYAPYVGVYRIDQNTGWNIHQLFVGLQPQTQSSRQQ
jgi:hypothetical protein